MRGMRSVAASVVLAVGFLAAACLWQRQAEGAEEEKAQDWEYKAVSFDSDEIQDTRKLNLLAADGWEYVGPLFGGVDDPPTKHGKGVVAFRRRTDLAEAKKELDKLQGHWKVITFESGGGAVNVANDETWSVDKDQFFFSTSRGSITLNPTAKVKKIDLATGERRLSSPLAPAGDQPVHSVSGIYSLDGDDLKLCFDTTGDDRPKEFSTEKNPARCLITLKRQKK
jgi:uncharacterized protein (TIGR03067 family)